MIGKPYGIREDLFGDWLWKGLCSPAKTRPNNKPVTIREADLSFPIHNIGRTPWPAVTCAAKAISFFCAHMRVSFEWTIRSELFRPAMRRRLSRASDLLT